MKTRNNPSPISFHEREVLERKVREGYSELEFGEGKWAGPQKITRIIALYHPYTDDIATIEHPMYYDKNGVRTGFPQEKYYTQVDFDNHVLLYKIKMDGEKRGIIETLQEWNE